MTARSVRVRADVALLALLVLAVVASLADVTGLRPAAVLAAMLLVPGGALLTRIEVEDGLAAIGIAIGLSLAVDTGIATVAAVAHWWHPALLSLAVAAGAAALLLHDLRELRIAEPTTAAPA